MPFCPCGARACLRFTRSRPDGRYTRQDRCSPCTDDFLMTLTDEEFSVWEVAPITQELLDTHEREDRRWGGTRQADLALMAFGEW